MGSSSRHGAWGLRLGLGAVSWASFHAREFSYDVPAGGQGRRQKAGGIRYAIPIRMEKPFDIRERTFLFACDAVLAFPDGHLEPRTLRVWLQCVSAATSGGAHLDHDRQEGLGQAQASQPKAGLLTGICLLPFALCLCLCLVPWLASPPWSCILHWTAVPKAPQIIWDLGAKIS